MTGTSVIITFNGNYIHSSDRPYSDFNIGRGVDKHIRRCIDGKKKDAGNVSGIAPSMSMPDSLQIRFEKNTTV